MGCTSSSPRKAPGAPVLFVAEGLNSDGSLVKNYQRGLQYATAYFGNYGPYYVYLRARIVSRVYAKFIESGPERGWIRIPPPLPRSKLRRS